jgi:hypothetical protein
MTSNPAPNPSNTSRRAFLPAPEPPWPWEPPAPGC